MGNKVFLELPSQSRTNYQRDRIEVEAISVDTITHFTSPPASDDLTNLRWFTQTFFMGVKSEKFSNLHSLDVYRGRVWCNKEILIMVDPSDPTNHTLWDWYIVRSTPRALAKIISCHVDWSGFSDSASRLIHSAAARISTNIKMATPIPSKGPIPENYGSF